MLQTMLLWYNRSFFQTLLPTHLTAHIHHHNRKSLTLVKTTCHLLSLVSECSSGAIESEPKSAAVWERNISRLLPGDSVCAGDAPCVCVCRWHPQNFTHHTDTDLCPDRPQQTPVRSVCFFVTPSGFTMLFDDGNTFIVPLYQCVYFACLSNRKPDGHS